MVDKVLHCKTHFEVLSIIDRKISLISKKNNGNGIIKQFVEKSLSKLKDLPKNGIESDQWAKIRVAIGHLENLKMHNSH